MRSVAAAIVLLAIASPTAASQDAPRAPVTFKLGVGVAHQDRAYRNEIGPALRIGAGRGIHPGLAWEAELGLERFGNQTGILYAPCNPDDVCPGMPGGALTLASGTFVLRRGAMGRAGGYALGGAGLTYTRPIAGARDRGYAHLTGALGWVFEGVSAHPFLEWRLSRYLGAEAPMSAWSSPVLVGLRF